jgi:hypothetical protein
MMASVVSIVSTVAPHGDFSCKYYTHLRSYEAGRIEGVKGIRRTAHWTIFKLCLKRTGTKYVRRVTDELPHSSRVASSLSLSE